MTTSLIKWQARLSSKAGRFCHSVQGTLSHHLLLFAAYDATVAAVLAALHVPYVQLACPVLLMAKDLRRHMSALSMSRVGPVDPAGAPGGGGAVRCHCTLPPGADTVVCAQPAFWLFMSTKYALSSVLSRATQGPLKPELVGVARPRVWAPNMATDSVALKPKLWRFGGAGLGGDGGVVRWASRCYVVSTMPAMRHTV